MRPLLRRYQRFEGSGKGDGNGVDRSGGAGYRGKVVCVGYLDVDVGVILVQMTAEVVEAEMSC